ncbi:macrolide 2'-phosphotransferase [Saccharopolyspora rhizosphaerae]|uniref:Macrolide 2'-phosphotransferase n=1 Tax=Saccharopolyspora rhizosphaerae TaxID=2492662 RepID=A0A426JYQ2_9PSEU|nr:macrolide 2'-phosphotransferase [Saccharopolyspora rhizosphaerae]RRO18268.1 macrolide 2'-phosphotransferase [Saccharopolyspora rhizosphaerae]
MLVTLARRHGLRVRLLELDESGWDFLVGHAVDEDGTHWVLRVPRRRAVSELIEGERRLLAHLRPRLPVALPDWEICTPELIAYRRLEGRPLGPEHPTTLEHQWWREPTEGFFTELGAVVAARHRTQLSEVERLGIPVSGHRDLREEVDDHLRLARGMFVVPAEKVARWRSWIDDDHSWSGPADLRLVHADLHPGHTLVDESGQLTGILDWTDAAVDDPALDFVAVHNAFGEGGLTRLLAGYAQAGGGVRAGFESHVRLLSEFRFSVSLGMYAVESGRGEFWEVAQRRLLA